MYDLEAADSIEKLMKAAKAMHTWIFLNSYDEMNAALGYGGQFVAEMSKEET